MAMTWEQSDYMHQQMQKQLEYERRKMKEEFDWRMRNAQQAYYPNQQYYPDQLAQGQLGNYKPEAMQKPKDDAMFNPLLLLLE